MDDPPEELFLAVDLGLGTWPLLIIFFVLCSAMFSASETAYFSLSRLNLDQLRNSGLPSDRRVLRHLSNPKRLLANLLIGNNVVNLTIILLFYYLLFKVLTFPGMPWLPALLQTFGVTAIIVFAGEVLPKVYAS
ncbi:MAG: CNNM domain-containing protein, partial [Bacteroidota bacterium]